MTRDASRAQRWRTVRVRAAEAESREAMIAALIAAGAGGVEERGELLVTHVTTDTDLDPVHAAAAAWPDVLVETEELGAVDWSDAWPTRVGMQTLGAITIVSSLTFIGLHPHDGNNISHRRPLPPPRGQIRADSRAVL